MKKTRWSGYDKYLVFSDKSSVLKGNYNGYLNFRDVMEVVNNLHAKRNTSYLYNGNIYKRKITSTDAKTILTNLEDCKWTKKTSLMLLVASQLKLRI